MKSFAILALFAARVVMALPAELSNTTTTTDAATQADAASETDVAAPATAVAPDVVSGNEEAADTYRYTVDCTGTRRQFCVNFQDTYCDTWGLLHTDDSHQCGNGNCWCVPATVYPCTHKDC